jgi:hypothetical protein
MAVVKSNYFVPFVCSGVVSELCVLVCQPLFKAFFIESVSLGIDSRGIKKVDKLNKSKNTL